MRASQSLAASVAAAATSLLLAVAAAATVAVELREEEKGEKWKGERCEKKRR